MGKTVLRAIGVAGALSWASAAGAAAPARDDEEARIARLEAAVAGLQAQVQSQSRAVQENAALRREVADLKAAKTPKTGAVALAPPATHAETPALTVSLKGASPGLATADGRFSINLLGLVQLDTAFYDQTAPGPIATDLRRTGPALGFTTSNADFSHARELRDGVLFRRARLGVAGNAFGPFEYRVVFDFGGAGVENAGQLYEAWAQYSGLKPFRLRVGAFAPLEGLADQSSTSAQPLLERPASADIARGLAGGDTRVGAQLFAGGDRWLVSVAVTSRTIGVINTGTATATPQAYRDPLAFVGRVAGTPLHGDGWRVHLGAHGQYLARPADITGPPATGDAPLTRHGVAFSDQGELRVDATRLINTGAIDARHASTAGVEFAAQWRNFLVQSEYDRFFVQSTVTGLGNPTFGGWYVEGSWVVTGETRRYNTGNAAFDGPPVHDGVGAGGFGVVELAVRYADMDLNDHAGLPGTAPAPDAVRGGELETWTGGVNWYLNPIVRLALEFQHVRLTRLSPDATVYQTPVGAQIGQSYNAVALRSQLAF
ncbi:MAG: porin [Caulobacteraceae bacterium]